MASYNIIKVVYNIIKVVYILIHKLKSEKIKKFDQVR